MQPTTPPRLTSDTGNQPGYAPVALAAVAALALALLFAVVLAVMALGSLRNGIPLTDSWIPFIPAVVIVLAFVARRQIRASEGTRTGERIANTAWWIAVASLVAYVASLQGNYYTVQRDARQQFDTWAKNLRELDAFNPKDDNLTQATWHVLPPGTRPSAKTDAARIEAAFADAVVMFRQTDVVRVCQRNRGNLTLTAQGLKDWAVKAGEITCTLGATIDCIEGEYRLELPMRAAVDDKGIRRWQIQPAGPEGYIKAVALTRVGWDTRALEADGALFGRRVTVQLGQPNPAAMMYLGYVMPGWEPSRAAVALGPAAADPGRAAAGTAVVAGASPLPADWVERTRKLFVKPDGSPHAPADVERLWRLWASPGMVNGAGGLLRNSPDLNGVLAVRDGLVEFRLPVEFSTGVSGSAYRGRVVYQLPAEVAAKVLAARAAAKPSDARSSAPPDDLVSGLQPWRIVRVETDLKTVQAEPITQVGGAG